jgi:antirestriction protein ArdC
MEKQNVYDVVTARIVALLEQGTVPWQKPWTSARGEDCFPRNLVSRKPYRGINTFLLHAMMFESPFWLTFKQAQELGGHVRKGEKSCPIIFWKWLEVQDKQTGEKKRIPFLRYTSAFNLAQCDGIEAPELPGSAENKREHSPIEAAERIVAGMPKRPEITYGSARACYSPAFDRVAMPRPESFRSGEDFYSVLLHELTHATGHESRLNRKGIEAGEWSAFGSAAYSKEELVAEMGAAFLCGHAGIVERTLDNSAAYIAAWLERLRNDRTLVVQAAAQAQRAADFILGVNHEASEVQS